MEAPVCSCGRTDPHIVARSRTLDEVALCLWSDGAITGCMGIYPPGTTAVRTDRGRGANRQLWPNISLYNWAELGTVIRQTRRTFKISKT